MEGRYIIISRQIDRVPGGWAVEEKEVRGGDLQQRLIGTDRKEETGSTSYSSLFS